MQNLMIENKTPCLFFEQILVLIHILQIKTSLLLCKHASAESGIWNMAQTPQKGEAK